MRIDRKSTPDSKPPIIEFSHTFLKINDIAGIRYTTEVPSNTVVIFGIGAPLPPDNGHLNNAAHFLARGFDVFVPDYIGSGRSDGQFTPLNCIKTFTQLFENFTDGCVGVNTYEKIRKEVRYDRVVIAGRSFAGTYIPVLPRFNRDIKELAVFFPVVDSKSQGEMKEEGEDETNELFLAGMKDDGYHHLYRGILDPEWIDHLENRDDLSPMDNIDHLANAKMFIGHGKKDTIVSYKKSEIYYDLLLRRFPKKERDFLLAIYHNGGHDSFTTFPGTNDFLDWLAGRLVTKEDQTQP